MQAIHNWRMNWDDQQLAAQEAFTAAFPALTPADRCQCFGPTLRWEKTGEGEGKVCLDDHGRATIDFERDRSRSSARRRRRRGAPTGSTRAPGASPRPSPVATTTSASRRTRSTTSTFTTTARSPSRSPTVKIDDIVTIIDELEQALAEHRAATA
jgi:hypothetical protein